MALLGGSGPQVYVELIYPAAASANQLIVPAKSKWVSGGSSEAKAHTAGEEDMFIITNRTQLKTTHFLMPIIYTYDREGIVIKDILEPRMSYFPYVLSSIGGEEIKKGGAIVGVVYINKNPVDIVPSARGTQTVVVQLGDLRSRLHIEIKKLTIKVANVTGFITKIWNSGIKTDSELVDTIMEKAKWEIKVNLQNKTLSEILKNAEEVRKLVFSIVQRISQEYYLRVVDAMIDINIPASSRDYYYWHVVKGIPEETVYAINKLKELKEATPELLPVVGPLLVVSILGQREDIRKITEAVLDKILQNTLRSIDNTRTTETESEQL